MSIVCICLFGECLPHSCQFIQIFSGNLRLFVSNNSSDVRNNKQKQIYFHKTILFRFEMSCSGHTIALSKQFLVLLWKIIYNNNNNNIIDDILSTNIRTFSIISYEWLIDRLKKGTNVVRIETDLIDCKYLLTTMGFQCHRPV